MWILNQIIGNYSQTIRIVESGNNEVEIKRNGEYLFKGIAKNIVDTGSEISFQDESGKKYMFTKYIRLTVS